MQAIPSGPSYPCVPHTVHAVKELRSNGPAVLDFLPFLLTRLFLVQNFSFARDFCTLLWVFVGNHAARPVSWTGMGVAGEGTRGRDRNAGFSCEGNNNRPIKKKFDRNNKSLAGARVILAGKDADVAGVPSERLCSIQVSETRLR